jgi:hypothetical protein
MGKLHDKRYADFSLSHPFPTVSPSDSDEECFHLQKAALQIPQAIHLTLFGPSQIQKLPILPKKAKSKGQQGHFLGQKAWTENGKRVIPTPKRWTVLCKRVIHFSKP